VAEQDFQELARAVRALREAAERVAQLSEGIPVAELNSYMIRQQIEMLEIEICDPVSVLSEAGAARGE
jgi:hypothetical protein